MERWWYFIKKNVTYKNQQTYNSKKVNSNIDKANKVIVHTNTFNGSANNIYVESKEAGLVYQNNELDIRTRIVSCLIAIIVSFIIYTFFYCLNNNQSNLILNYLGSSLLGYLLSFNFFIALIVEKVYNKGKKRWYYV